MLPTTPSYSSGQLQQTVWGCQTRRAWQPGLSLLTPTHLHCLSTSTGHLPCGPHPSSNHHILLTISLKPFSIFQCPARVSARLSKPCGFTGYPHMTAAQSMYTSFSHSKSSGQALYAAAKHRRSELPAGAFPPKLRVARSSRPRNPRLRQPTRRRLLCRGRQRRAKASQRPPYAAPGPAVGHIQAAALAAQSSRERIGSTGSGILFWQQTAAVTAADRPMQS